MKARTMCMWLVALDESNELSTPLRRLWEAKHGRDPVREAKNGQLDWQAAVGAVGTVGGIGLMCLAGVNMPWPWLLMAEFSFLGLAVFWFILGWHRMKSAASFFTHLRAARNIWNLPFEKMAGLPIENLVAFTDRSLVDQQKKRAHAEFSRQHQVLLALGLAKGDKAEYIGRAIEESANAKEGELIHETD